MTVKTKRVIDSVTFTPDEINFLNSLVNLMETECKLHPNCCDDCPFFWKNHNFKGAICEDVLTTLRIFANEGIQS